MQVAQEPLSAAEEDELRGLLSAGSGRSLAFARGVFHAAATAPGQPLPPEWLGLILGDDAENATTLRRTFALLMRDYNSCVECLALGVPAVPAATDPEGVADFCKGYVRVAQKDARWTGNFEAFELTAPLAVLAGYLDDAKILSLAEGPLVDAEAWKQEQREGLGDSIARGFDFWAESRKAQPATSEKTGRNEPCPCGSGKKFKKCCGAS